MEKKIVHFSRFVPVTSLGGGARRTIQIIKILKPFSPEMISAGRGGDIYIKSPEILGLSNAGGIRRRFDKGGELKYWGTIDLHTIAKGSGSGKTGRHRGKIRFFNKISNIFKSRESKHWSTEHRKKVNRFREISEEWADRVDPLKLGMAIVDDPIYFPALVRKLKKSGIPIVAVSHNIETLAMQQVARQHQKNLLVNELKILEKCDLLIAISREEEWLLRSLGMNALFFPYYPVDDVLTRMLRIRDKRKKRGEKGFLLMGSAFHAANRQGMFAVIDAWKNKKFFLRGDPLFIAGFKTDMYLKDIKNEENIVFLGPLSDEELDEKMSTVKACLVHQTMGSGALTRIIEMLVAGVPVLANTYAARSYHNLPGVIEFHNLNGLAGVFKEIEKVEGQIPIPSEPDPSYLVEEIKRIMHR